LKAFSSNSVSNITAYLNKPVIPDGHFCFKSRFYSVDVFFSTRKLKLKKGEKKMRKTSLILGLTLLLMMVLFASASHCKTIQTKNGDVYRDACEDIKVGTLIYRYLPATKSMTYVGEVVDLGRAYNERIVWIWVERTKRIEPKTRKAVCDWGWVKVGTAEK
jgi:hypothetical protein